jgi:hypothetical protein
MEIKVITEYQEAEKKYYLNFTQRGKGAEKRCMVKHR